MCMTTMPAAGRHPFDAPAVYQIRIEGFLEAAWSDRVEGMVIYVEQAEDGRPITTLRGELADQAALSGILVMLYDMQMTVMSVLRL